MNEANSYGLKGGGYRAVSSILSRAFNGGIAVVLFLVTLPIMVVVYLLVLLTSGLPVIYVGTRLGRGAKAFRIYKFRTLATDAEERIGADSLTYEHELTTPIGRFLRQTRLDELPQLVNILAGDMDFVGPDPVRPAVYETICRHIPNYDTRFAVRPGLIGFSQLFTPPDAPERVRTLVDNALVRRKRRFLWDLGMIFFAGIVVVRLTIRRMGRRVFRYLFFSQVLRQYDEKRGTERLTPNAARVCVCRGMFAPETSIEEGTLININERAFLMRSPAKMDVQFPALVRLEREIKRRGGGRRIKRAVCQGRLYREEQREDGQFDYVIEYTPISPLSFYMTSQYFLERSMA